MPNLYLIESKDEFIDHYDKAVVCACSEQEARLIHPNGYYVFNNGSGSFVSKQTRRSFPSGHFSGWTHPNKVKVTLIGISSEHMQTGMVILASVRAL